MVPWLRFCPLNEGAWVKKKKKKLKIYLFTYYWLLWVLDTTHRLSLASGCGGGGVGYSLVVVLYAACGILPGIEPMSPALAGRFLSTVPLEKSQGQGIEKDHDSYVSKV